MLVDDMLASFPRVRAMIVGDAILDTFVVGTPTRLCRERPVPVLVKHAEHVFPGGAANVAANARALGADVRFVSALDAGTTGRSVRAVLAAHDVPLADVIEVPDARNAAKMRVLADDQYVARVDEEAFGFENAAVQQRLLERLRDAYASADVAIVSDYGGGCIGPLLLRGLRALRRVRPIPLIVDARDLTLCARLEADVLTPNLEEAARLAGIATPDPRDVSALERLASALAKRTRRSAVAVTLGQDGILIVRDGGAQLFGGRHVAVRNTCGAGDSFAASLAIGLAAGGDVVQAARLALEAAAVAVAKPFTATVRLAELRERRELLDVDGASVPAGELDAAARRLQAYRERGAKIVLTNGVFDLLNAGHVSLLQRARALGDVLVVAINSDRSARLIKGPNRPITGHEQRRALVRALDCVDEVVSFEGLTAEHVVEVLRPDLYVRGQDWPVEDLPEARAAERVGARVILLPRTSELTTRGIIERVISRTPHWSPLESPSP
jgi:D-beta-D-heptose 7-phosphate kinase/D-beta-D-heptose 1-phosphate adenosyltransferase